MSERAPPPLATMLATWFGSGRIRWAPGTWGSLAALPFAFAIQYLWGPWALLGAAVVVFLIGWWASDSYVHAAGRDDPSEVVIDEVAGQWLALLPAAVATWWHWPLGFVLFRVFDIVKPWPVGTADRRLKGGFGVMADDVIAGVYAGAFLYLLIAAGSMADLP